MTNLSGVLGAITAKLEQGARPASDDALLCFAAVAILAMNRMPQMIARIGAERLAVLAVGPFGMGIAMAAQIGLAILILLNTCDIAIALGADLASGNATAHVRGQAGAS